jgi:hypothetical protein
MARPRTWRVLVFALICIPSVMGVWAAFNAGRSALSTIGGVLVAFVSALMLGALDWVIGMFLLKPVQPVPRAPASPPRTGRDSAGEAPSHG